MAERGSPAVAAQLALSPRIERLRTASRARGAHQPQSQFRAALSHAWAQHADLPLRERQARAMVYAIEHLPVYLFPEEHLVGMVYHLGGETVDECPFTWLPTARERVKRALPQDEELVALGVTLGDAAQGHVTWHWEWILQRGVLGLLEEHRQALANAPYEVAAFHCGVICVLEALLRWNQQHVEALQRALQVAPHDDLPRLRELLEICQRVPAHPARTFREAVQSFWMQYLVVMRENPYGGNGPGRLDFSLWPYLERDLAMGVCSMADARELVDELFIRLHERILDADGWVEAVVVGGSHPDARSAVNPLSHVMVESIMALDQLHPSVYMRVPADPPDSYRELASHYLVRGHNRAQVLNDPAIMRAMSLHGASMADASMYTCGGCMEIVSQGTNSDLLFAGYHSVPKTVELVLTGGECLLTGRRLGHASLPALTLHDTFEALYDSFSDELRRELLSTFQRYDLYSETLAALRPAYLLSAMTDDCTAHGRELHDGGARYHDYGSSPMGIPNAGDALYAVKRAVFEDHICDAEELLAALRADFCGYETLRHRLRALPKFGQGHAEADAMTDRVLTTVCDIYDSYRNRWGGRAKPVILTFVWAPVVGDSLGATAYGDRARRPIAQSMTPQSAAMTEGITAAMRSHTSLPLHRVAGGASSMWDLDTQWATPKVAQALLSTFLRLGGHIFQGNTTDIEELIHAREHPEEHPNLFVRVGGFSARFVTLDTALQDEIIQRHRHSS